MEKCYGPRMVTLREIPSLVRQNYGQKIFSGFGAKLARAKAFNVQSRDATPAPSKAKGSRGKYIPPFQRNRGESKSNSPSEKVKRLRSKPESKRSRLYKTQLCETYEEFGECKYGSNCQYAHGKEELREKPAPYRPSAYKTVRCKNYWSKDSICPYGSKCRFIHEEATGIDERKIEKNEKSL